MKYFCSIILLFILSSCSGLKLMPVNKTRTPAEVAPTSCNELAKSIFMTESYEKDLIRALEEKKLLSFTNKSVAIHYPKLEWINRAKISLNNSIKNWNNNKYPAFYLYSDEEIVLQAKTYFKTIEGIISPEIMLAPEANKNFEMIQSWIKNFSQYQEDLNRLYEERISLEYNLSLLKKIELSKNEIRDIRLQTKKDGELIDQIITIREKDKDLKYQISKFKSDIREFDGTLFSNGKIKDRIIRQAMLLDMLTILHREFEFAVKNTTLPHTEVRKELERISALLEKSDFRPSTYGVYKITNKVFIREVIALSKLDIAYKNFIETPALKFKEVVQAFIENRKVKDDTKLDAEKIGIFKRFYSMITSITPKQAVTGTGIVAIAGIGIDRYYASNKSSTQELEDQVKLESSEQASEVDLKTLEPIQISNEQSHLEQLKQTEEIQIKKSEGHSTVIEVLIGS